jgi:small conductance mechanosensitive channel
VLSISSVIFILAAVSLQQSLANVAATVIFLAFQPFRRGEVIETLGMVGTVQEIQLFNTVLHLGNQRMASLSNSEIQSGGVVNHTRRGIIRNEITFMVSYQTDLGRVRQIVQALLDQDARILRDPAPSITVLELGDTGVRLVVYCMSAPDDGVAVTSDLRTQIKTRFDVEGIPFARQEVNITAIPAPDVARPSGDAAASAA